MTFGQKPLWDTSSYTSIVVLKEGIESANAITNDSTIFIAKKGQLMLYWSNSHTAIIADGRDGYVPPEKIKRVNTPYFKFTFTKESFIYNKENELYIASKKNGADINNLTKRINNKDNKALFQFFKLYGKLDGGAADEFMYDFWALINLWTDKELDTFISTLNNADKKDFCSLLIETAYCNPYDYYKLYYPLTLKQIKAIK